MKMTPQYVLLVSPKGFDVKYSINPHMQDASGRLNVVDKAFAQEQWQALKAIYQKLDFQVYTIPDNFDYPDMVFCANQTFPFLDENGNKCVLMSQMHAEQRKGEVEVLRHWFQSQQYRVYDLRAKGDLEGAGDLIWDYEGCRVFAGFGFRTSPEVLNEAQKLVKVPFIHLELRDERFYHLDTCLAVLNSQTALYVKEAFTAQGLRDLQKSFSDLIAVDIVEAETKLAANAHCPDGRNVIIQSGCQNTIVEIKKRGFKVHETNTSEYIKAGGSVYCLKQMFY